MNTWTWRTSKCFNYYGIRHTQIHFYLTKGQYDKFDPHFLPFRFGSAEDLPVEDSSVTLITAGRAIQYFDFPKFFRECQRALAPGGIVAFYSSEHIKFVIDDDPAKAEKLNKLFTKVWFYYVESNTSGI